MTKRRKKLKHIDDSALSIFRKHKGKGFAFYDENGQKLKDKKVLKRLKQLVIPPMWTDVQVCKFKDGHIQAIGRDAKGRKQYIYHSAWERMRQEEKFAKMKKFGKKLKVIRKQTQKDLRKNSWTKKKVLALIVSILDDTGIRIGNRQYVKKNGTYGLTTLRRKHLSFKDDELIFSFKGKSGKEREVYIDDNRMISQISKSAQLPGYEIFRYKDKDGSFSNIDSSDVNQYITDIIGKDFSSKDFRTWYASRLAIDYYPQALEKQRKIPKKKFTNTLIKMVAEELGNTPTVCKSYYIHPSIYSLIDKKSIPNPMSYKDDKKTHGLTASEKFLLKSI